VKWQLKARLQNSIASLPYISNAVYYAVQRSVGGLRSERIDPVDRMKAGFGMVAWAAEAGVNLRGATVLEVGTGRMIDLPTAMWLAGADRIITVDLNPYLSLKLVSEARRYIRDNAELIGPLYRGSDIVLFRERLKILTDPLLADSDLLGAMNIQYMSPADAAHLPIEDASTDLHVSHTVLEHIPGDVLGAILIEARRVLRPSGLVIHNIDPSDHFSHDDPSISRINFLRFSEREWDKWAGNQFMYHNRLRASDYVRLFSDAGITILREEREVDERSLDELDSGFPLDQRFADLPRDEVATTSISLMGQFAPTDSEA
jgi:SAM-dependent methyltransferase